MHIRLLLVCLFVTLTASAQSLKDYFKKQNRLIKDVEIFKSKDDSFVVAVIGVIEPDWWEILSIIKLKNGKILWQATFDSLPGEQSIRPDETTLNSADTFRCCITERKRNHFQPKKF
jgi:hypothetical protein